MKEQEPMTIVVLGATGFVGRNLVRALLEHTPHRIRAVARDTTRFTIFNPRLELLSGDAHSPESMSTALKGARVAYYLVHRLDSKNAHFDKEESDVAETFGIAACDAGITRVIYLSGLGCDSDKLSHHLASRHHTGEILRKYIPTVLEFRASMIIGDGSASFEIVKGLVEKLPIILLPKSANTLAQPIGLSDVIHYLIAGISLPSAQHEIIEIGGPQKISYCNFLKLYATEIQKHCIVVRIPILPGWITGWFLYFFLPKRLARVGRHMVGSFQNTMVVTNNRARELFPHIIPERVENSFE